MGTPEIGFVWLSGVQHLLKGKTLPAGAAAWMLPKGGGVGNAPQVMQQTAVPDVDLGRLDLAFAQVFVPWWQLSHQL